MAKVNSEILSWARKKSQLSLEDAARKLKINDSKKMSASDKLALFESAEKEVSRSLLVRMSKQYHVPLLMFYLNRPPELGERGSDFRKLPVGFDEKENVNVDILIREIKARQNTMRETLIDADEEIKLEFIAKHKIEDGVSILVHTIRALLNFEQSEFRNQPNNREAFRFLRKKIETQGIFVLLKGNLGSYHSNIPVTIFRGFALADNVAPFIVINDQDSEAAWAFTMIHELIHLILGLTGVSNSNFESVVEKFCNDVTSEFFLPEVEFNTFKFSRANFEQLKSEISEYATLTKLSNTHIAYRLYKSGSINEATWNSLHEFYFKKWEENRERERNKNKLKDGGPSYYILQKYKLGSLVDIVERLTYSGAISTTKAGMLLDTKPLKVHRLFSYETNL